jgi:hypothetical protein
MDTMGLMQTFELVNLLKRYPGRQGKGDKFNLKYASRVAKEMMYSNRLADRQVILLGKNLAKAFGLQADYLEWNYFGWCDRDGKTQNMHVVIVPHPSGINRWWNDPKNAAKVATFLKTLL